MEVPTKHQHSELKSSEMLIKNITQRANALLSADTWSFENDSREAPLVSVMKNRISECLE